MLCVCTVLWGVPSRRGKLVAVAGPSQAAVLFGRWENVRKSRWKALSSDTEQPLGLWIASEALPGVGRHRTYLILSYRLSLLERRRSRVDKK